MSLSNLHIRNISSLSILVFGVLALVLGLIGLIRPETMLQLLGFEMLERAERVGGDFTVTFLTASSMASFNMGVYYVLAALTNTRQFFVWTVPFRIVTFAVFMLAVARGFAPVGLSVLRYGS